MKRVIGYTRISPRGQGYDGVSLEMQAGKIRAYCTANDPELDLVEMIIDDQISAKDIKGRPGFQRALEMVRAELDGLVIWKLDRAFRNTREALEVAEDFNKRGKALHSVSEKLDTTSAIGEFFFTLMASLAQMERRLVGERTAAALAHKHARGEKTGGYMPFGRALGTDGKTLIPNLEEQAYGQRARALLESGKSQREVARIFAKDKILNRKGKMFTPQAIKAMSEHSDYDSRFYGTCKA